MPFRVAFASGARQFEADAQESLLDAAERAGISRAWRCTDGSCGSCRSTVLQGKVAIGDGTSIQVIDAAAGPQPILLCQSRARSALRLAARHIPDIDDLACRPLTLELSEKLQLTPQLLSLTLRAPPGARLCWLPGQYLEILVSEGDRRAFSIANVCDGSQVVELHVRHGHDDRNQRLFGPLQPGQHLRVQMPLGTFVPREDSQRPMLFVAGGTGFAPIKAIIEHFVQLGARRPMQLYWGVRHPRELYLREHVETWVRELPLLNFQAVISEPHAPVDPGMRRGNVVDAVLADHPDLQAWDVYACGPPRMVDAACHAFASAGLPTAQLLVDSYTYAPDLLAAILQQRAGFVSD